MKSYGRLQVDMHAYLTLQQTWQFTYRLTIWRIPIIFISVLLTEQPDNISLRESAFRRISLLKPTGYVMHQQFNIQQFYVLPTLYLCILYLSERGRHSSVGIATRYGLDGPRIEYQWGRDFPHPSRPALGSTQPPVQWVPGLSRG